MNTRFGIILLMLSVLLVAVAPSAAQDPADFVPYQQAVMLCDPSGSAARAQTICTATTDAAAPVAISGDWIVQRLALSPDGRYIAFTANPPDFDETTYRETYFEGPLPQNLGIIDLALPADDPDRLRMIADQTTLTNPDAGHQGYRYRTQPQWSTDSTRVAWLDYDNTSTTFGGLVYVFDIATDEVRQVGDYVSLGWADGGFWGIPNLGGWVGDTVYSVSLDYIPAYEGNPDNAFGHNLSIIDTATGATTVIPIEYFASYQDRGGVIAPVVYEGTPRLALNYAQSGLILYDPATGTFSALAGALTAEPVVPSSQG